MSDISLADRILGCLYGGALGDALGGPYEGKPLPVEFRLPDSARISDDTQLTLATCEAMTSAGSVNPESIAAQFLVWFRERRLSGLGSSTLKALRDLDAGGHWALSGARGERSAGNGAAMRAAPLAFLLDPNLAGDRTCLRDVCRITHHHDEAYIGALAIVTAIRCLAFDGCSLHQELLNAVVSSLPDSQVRDRLAQLIALRSSTSSQELARKCGASGFVADSVPLALIIAAEHATADVLVAIQAAVACGGDTDTIAALTGQIVGAAHGVSAIPKQICRTISDWQLIEEVAEQFAAFATAR